MTLKTDAKYTAEFIVREANGYRSRQTGTIAEGEVVVAGEVLEFDSAGELIAYVGTDTFGVDQGAVISLDNYDASAGALGGCVYIARDCEVNLGELTYASGGSASVVANLAKNGIICRENAVESPES